LYSITLINSLPDSFIIDVVVIKQMNAVRSMICSKDSSPIHSIDRLCPSGGKLWNGHGCSGLRPASRSALQCY